MSKIIQNLHDTGFYFICQISFATPQSFFSYQCKEQMALNFYINERDFGMK